MPRPSSGDLPDLGIEPGFPTLWANSLSSEPPSKPEKYSHTSYTMAAFTLASGHLGLEIKILYHCTLYNESESENCSVLSDCLPPRGLYSPWNSPGQKTGVSSLSLLQGVFPTQGSNRGLPRCRRILYHLSHQGSPRMLEWIAYPFCSRSSPLRD